MSEIFILCFKQIVHLNLNLALLVILVWLCLGKGRTYRTALVAWSVLLIRFFLEPFLCPETTAAPILDFSQMGTVALGLGLGPGFETLLLLVSLGSQRISVGDLAVLSVGDTWAHALGFLMLLAVGFSVMFRAYDLWCSQGEGLGLIWSDQSDNAYISGWLRPSIVMPVRARTLLSKSELKAVIEHEKAHLHYGDHRTFALLHLLKSFSIAIPPLAIIINNLELALERRCDALAADKVGSKEVARALVKMALHKSNSAQLAPGFSKHSIEARIRHLRPSHQKESKALYPVLLLFLGAVFL